jgi:hypothetical protein
MWLRRLFENRSPPKPRPDLHRLFAIYCGAVSPAAAARTILKTKGTP